MLLLSASTFISGYALVSDAAHAADRSKILTEPELDAVNAGLLHFDLNLSASADGPSGATSTQGSIAVANTTVARVAIDPSAPAQAQARLLGFSQAAVGFAHGLADASGGSNPECAATVDVEGGDAVKTTQTSTLTEMTATCACSAFAVEILLTR